jgi:hypothetical protein
MRSRGPIQAECKRAGCVPGHDVGDGVVAIVAIPPRCRGRRRRDGSDTNSQQIDLAAGRTLTESRHYSAFCGSWRSGRVFCPFPGHPKGFAEMDSRRLIRGAWISAPISPWPAGRGSAREPPPTGPKSASTADLAVGRYRCRFRFRVAERSVSIHTDIDLRSSGEIGWMTATRFLLAPMFHS